MPKELTHWYLAMKVGEALGAGDSFPVLARCIQACPHTFLLGAVGPDYLFYYLKGPERQTFREAAMVLHGRDGGNTLRPFASVADAFGGRFGSAVGAFLLGYLVHVSGDATFHPLVLHTVGKGAGKPQYEHHVFESVLDLYVLDRWGRGEGGEPLLPRTLKELTRGMSESGELPRQEFLRLLGVVSFLGKPYNEKELEKCLRWYEVLQSWFWSPLACWATGVLKALNPALSFLEASCYQRRFYRYREAFHHTLEYRHPVTGEERRGSIEDLVKETVERFFAYAPRLEELFQRAMGNIQVSSPSPYPRSDRRDLLPEVETPAEVETAEVETMDKASGDRAAPLGGSKEGREGFQALEGPNLETGLTGDRADRILHTRPEGLEGLFGSYGYRP